MSSRKRTAELLAQAHRDARNRMVNRSYIWQSLNWPRLRCDMAVLTPALLQARNVQAQLMGLLTSLNLFDQNDAQSSSWVQEAQSTAHIEGEVLQLNSVRASVARRLGLTQTDNRQDSATEGMLDILQSALGLVQQGKSVDADALHDWHAALFPTGRSGFQKIAVGQYRSHVEPMQIVTPTLNGNDVVHYQAPASSTVAAHMHGLLAWFDASRTAQWPTDGLVRAALVHLWFEAIHPYEDGNGRIGRALSELALFQDWQTTFKETSEEDNVKRVFSLSQQLWLDRKGYYAQLQAATGAGNMDVTPWVAWFVNCVTLAMQAAMSHIHTAIAKNHFWHAVATAVPALSTSQRKVLGKLYDTPDGFKNGLSTELYCGIATCSRATAYRDLTQLLEAGLLTQWGVGRGTRYGLVRIS
jgi:Fic family protein